MIKPLLVEPDAIHELDAAARWYEDQGSGLGQRFLDAVAATLDRLVISPLLARGSHMYHVAAFPTMSSTSTRV